MLFTLSACDSKDTSENHEAHIFSITFTNETDTVEATAFNIGFSVDKKSKPFATSTISAPYTDSNNRPSMKCEEAYSASFSCQSLPAIENPPLEQITISFDLDGKCSVSRTYAVEELWGNTISCSMTAAGLDISLISPIPDSGSRVPDIRAPCCFLWKMP